MGRAGVRPGNAPLARAPRLLRPVGESGHVHRRARAARVVRPAGIVVGRLAARPGDHRRDGILAPLPAGRPIADPLAPRPRGRRSRCDRRVRGREPARRRAGGHTGAGRRRGASRGRGYRRGDRGARAPRRNRARRRGRAGHARPACRANRAHARNRIPAAPAGPCAARARTPARSRQPALPPRHRQRARARGVVAGCAARPHPRAERCGTPAGRNLACRTRGPVLPPRPLARDARDRVREPAHGILGPAARQRAGVQRWRCLLPELGPPEDLLRDVPGSAGHLQRDRGAPVGVGA